MYTIRICAGLHFVPLRTPGGESASHIGIFVEIKLSLKQVSSIEMYSHQGLNNNLSPTWSSSKLTCTSRGRETEDTISPVKEHDHKNIKQVKTTSVSSLYRAHGGSSGNDFPLKQSRLGHQEAVIQCTAEIHSNPFTDGTIV